jgi:hypothetical protein
MPLLNVSLGGTVLLSHILCALESPMVCFSHTYVCLLGKYSVDVIIVHGALYFILLLCALTDHGKFLLAACKYHRPVNFSLGGTMLLSHILCALESPMVCFSYTYVCLLGKYSVDVIIVHGALYFILLLCALADHGKFLLAACKCHRPVNFSLGGTMLLSHILCALESPMVCFSHTYVCLLGKYSVAVIIVHGVLYFILLLCALADHGKFLLAACKCHRSAYTEYLISLDAKNTSKGTYIGKLR